MISRFKTLIHIGLPKSRSTYLQSNLARVPGVRLIEHSKLLQLRLAAFDEVCADGAIEQLMEEAESNPSDSTIIVSDERLSSWRHTDFRWLAQETVRSYQERCAALLKRAFGSAQILILVRSPRSWLSSIHAQYVKAGETRSLTEFCQHNRDYLIQACRVDDLVEVYARYFGPGSVAVFPVEASDSPGVADWRDWVDIQCGGRVTWANQACYRALDPAVREAQINVNRIIESLADGAVTTSAETAALKTALFRFVDRTLVDNSVNQRRLRRLLRLGGNTLAARSFPDQGPPDDIALEALQGMSETLRRPEFARVLNKYR